MTREQLEHILRAAGAITGADRFVVVGSQAILGQFPEPPAELAVSIEADVFSPRGPEDAELIDGTIGELSPFHRTFGYYAHGISIDTAVLPEGWTDRLVSIVGEGTGGVVGQCVEVHDLAVSKLIAGREKDLSYISALLTHRMADPQTIRDRLARTSIDGPQRAACETRLRRLIARLA